MFKNIGKKIKVLAKTLCVIQIVLFVILGVVLMFSGKSNDNGDYLAYDEYSDYYYGDSMSAYDEYWETYHEESATASTASVGGFFAGLLVMVFGALGAWLSSFLLYGFGELIDKTCEIAKNTTPECAYTDVNTSDKA